MGDRDRALADARECLKLSEKPAVMFQVAGIYALTSRMNPRDRREALRWLAGAVLQGFEHEQIDMDTDLEPLRADPSFEEFRHAARVLDEAMRQAQRESEN
jgi:hypothetical protein